MQHQVLTGIFAKILTRLNHTLISIVAFDSHVDNLIMLFYFWGKGTSNVALCAFDFWFWMFTACVAIQVILLDSFVITFCTFQGITTWKRFLRAIFLCSKCTFYHLFWKGETWNIHIIAMWVKSTYVSFHILYLKNGHRIPDLCLYTANFERQ